MPHRVTVLLLAAILLAACGGGGDDDDDGDAGGAVTQAAATATEPGANAPTATVVRQRATVTTPERATAAATEPSVAATQSSSDDGGDAEQRLFEMLLTADDLGTDWIELNRDSQMEEGVSEEAGFCNTPAFEQYTTRIANVEGDSRNEAQTRYLLQNIILFPADVVDDAWDFSRDALTCTEFDDDGTTYQVIPIDDPALDEIGDDAFGATIAAVGENQVVQIIYLRVGDILSSMAYVDIEDPDAAVDGALDIARKAADRIAAVE